MNTNIFKEKLNKDFISNNFGKQYLYNKDFLQNTSSIMSLDILNEVLSMSSNWNNHNFVIMLDKERIKYNEYSSLSLEASGQFMRPDPEKVQNWVSKEASIILNDIDKVNSGLINIQSITGYNKWKVPRKLIFFYAKSSSFWSTLRCA